jgi:hypothetical protein
MYSNFSLSLLISLLQKSLNHPSFFIQRNSSHATCVLPQLYSKHVPVFVTAAFFKSCLSLLCYHTVLQVAPPFC